MCICYTPCTYCQTLLASQLDFETYLPRCDFTSQLCVVDVTTLCWWDERVKVVAGDLWWRWAGLAWYQLGHDYIPLMLGQESVVAKQGTRRSLPESL